MRGHGSYVKHKMAKFCQTNEKNLKLILSILFLIVISKTFAQNSGISGIVVDEDFGDPLIGVNVFIENSTRGAATDIHGQYSITGLESGTYTISFSMIGFQKKTISDFELKSNEIKKLDIVLGVETYETEEVIISAKAISNTEASLLAKGKNQHQLAMQLVQKKFLNPVAEMQHLQ